MDFSLSEEQRLIQETIRNFVAKEVIVNAYDWDKKEELPREIIDKLFELGLMGIMIDPEYGGTGLDLLSQAVVIEELAKGDGSLALMVAVQNSLCTGHINAFGNEQQKQEFLPQLITGKKVGGWALTEPGSGSDSSSLKTRAVKQGNDWLINGTKAFITHAVTADIFVVLTLTEPGKKHRGITAFILEKGDRGFRSGKKLEKLGMRASDTGDLILEDVLIPDSRRLGEVNEGFINTMMILDKGRVGIGALSVGLAQASLDDSLKYAQQRETFGKLLKDHDLIKATLTDMAVDIDAARLLVHRAAVLGQQGKSITLEASIAKLFASEMAMRVCNKGIQIHGGYGYTKEFRLERLFRDAKLAEIGEGTSEIQRLVIAKELFKRFS